MFNKGDKVTVDDQFLPFGDIFEYEGEEFKVIKTFNSFIKIKLDQFETKIVPKKACTKVDKSQYSKQKRKLKL